MDSAVKILWNISKYNLKIHYKNYISGYMGFTARVQDDSIFEKSINAIYHISRAPPSHDYINLFWQS